MSGSNDKTLKKWALTLQRQNDTITGITVECTGTVIAHEKDINSVCVSPNDKLIASASQDKLIKVWDGRQISKLVGVLKGHRRGVWSVEFSPLDQCVLSASADATVRVWSLKDFTCLRTLQDHSQAVVRACYVNKGTQCISNGADGVIKLWSLKNSECVATFTEHPASAKVWALGVTAAIADGEDGAFFVTGGTDSNLLLWQENTAQVFNDQSLSMQQKTLQLQELEQSLAQKNFKKAMQMSFALDQPYKLLQLIEELLNSVPSSLPDQQAPHAILQQLVRSLTPDQLDKCLRYIRDWNTTSRHCVASQQLLKAILVVFPPQKLQQLPNIKEIVEGLLPYSERHFQRYDRLIQKSYLLDYMIQRMNSIILPDAPSDGSMAVDILSSFPPPKNSSSASKQASNTPHIDDSEEEDDEELGLIQEDEEDQQEDDNNASVETEGGDAEESTFMLSLKRTQEPQTEEEYISAKKQKEAQVLSAAYRGPSLGGRGRGRGGRGRGRFFGHRGTSSFRSRGSSRGKFFRN